VGQHKFWGASVQFDEFFAPLAKLRNLKLRINLRGEICFIENKIRLRRIEMTKPKPSLLPEYFFGIFSPVTIYLLLILPFT
jgi:hypothetical protein